jgi:hypothetical protein
MSVTILCHRGWWTKPEEQNTLAAFARAFDAGLGVELDVRDWCGQLIVAHDPPGAFVINGKPGTNSGGVALMGYFFQEVIELLGDRPNTLAVNVKSCGLAPWFAEIERKPKNWFFFDAAPGDDEEYRKLGLPLYVRERWSVAVPVLTISPEVFGFDHLQRWDDIREASVKEFLLVTDRVQEAMGFFARG